MKKNNILYACAAAALVFASCQKEAPVSEGTIPETPTAEMNVITAKTAGTKVTTLDGVNVLWDKGDKIQLFTRTWNEGSSKFDAGWCDYTTTLDAPSATASFVRDEANTSTVDNTSGKYLAINHKGATVVTQSRDYYGQIALNKEQVAKNGGDFVSTLLYAASENSEFTFSHAVAYVKFTVDQNTTPFKKLTVSPVNSSEIIVSRVEINWAGETVTAAPFTGKSQDSKTVSVTTDDAAAFAPGTYHIAINTGTYADGLKLTFSNGSEDVVVTTPSNVLMKAGDVANLGTIGKLDFPAPTQKFEPSLYVENGEKMGVVFWVDPTDPSKGKAISGAVYTDVQWHTSTDFFTESAASFTSDDSKANFDYLLNSADYKANTAAYPAVNTCVALGDGWRLPTVEEFKDLFRAYTGHKGEFEDNKKYYETDEQKAAIGIFDALLNECQNGQVLAPKGMTSANWYWTGQAYNSTDANHGKIYRIKLSDVYYVGTAKAKGKNLVRCVRDVEIK